MDALFLVAVFIIKNLHKFATQEKDILRAIGVSMDRDNSSWK